MFAFSALPPYKEQGCCDSGCGCKTSNPVADLACPYCDQVGEGVSNLTVYSLCKKSEKPAISKEGENGFALCMNPACSVAYYNSSTTIEMNALKRDIHFKDDAKEHYICYCLKITKQQVEDTIIQKKLTGMQDIMKELVGPPPCKCEINNPTGLCCDTIFNALIKDVLARA